jgi:cholesterol transport system auxiliary component
MIMWMGLLFTWLAASFLFIGCVSIEKSYPDKRYFVLDIVLDASPQNPAETGTLQIASARVSPRYADKNFVYRRSDTRFESDFYNEFLISPGVLVAEELRQGLSQSGLFKFVVGSVDALAPTHTLETVVNSLYGDFRDVGAPQAVMEVEFFLSQEGSPSGIVFHKRYHSAIPLEGRNPEALVQGWNRALEAISGSLVSDLKASNVRLERRSTSRAAAFQLGWAQPSKF